MSGHPMLQPSDWSVTPSALHGETPKERRELYQLVWDCALASTLVPPVLRHTRALFRANKVTLAVASVTVGNRLGFWRYRQDYPAWPFPVSLEPVPDGELVVSDVRVVEGEPVTMRKLILEMVDRHIGTAASMAVVLEKTISLGDKQNSKALLFLHSGNGANEVGLTDRGRVELDRWREHDLVDDNQLRTQVVRDIAAGHMGYREGLEHLFDDDRDGAALAARHIDELCSRWSGVEREATLSALVGIGHVPAPVFPDLPKWLDPELLLDADHPLRALRAEMESSLLENHPQWLSMLDEQRVEARVVWLRSVERLHPELEALLNSGLARFSSVWVWLTGSRGD